VLVYAPDELPPEPAVTASVTALRMLADPTRLRLLWLIRDGESDVGTLAAALGAARPAVSQHLAKLLLAGLVSSRRQGRQVFYRARNGHVRRLVTEAVSAGGHLVSGEPDHD
jgi:DNA-binding transcriptional ArsR family regulator